MSRGPGSLTWNQLSRRLWKYAWLPAMLLVALGAGSQTPEDYDAARKQAFALVDLNKLTEALPILEKLAAEQPSDARVLSRLGLALVGHAAGLNDTEEQRKMRVRARDLLLRAKKLGDTSPLVDAIAAELPADGVISPFSNRKEVDDIMREGERAFARGDFDASLAAYGRALVLDPKQYFAALFTGDVYFKTKRMDKAEEWFQRAVEIDPDIETAHRYLGDALLADGKADQARAEYIEVVIAEPYNRLAWEGLKKWAQQKGVQLSHPVVKVPQSVSSEKGNTTITIDPDSLTGNKDTGFVWLAYGGTRALWSGEKFAKEFPGEKTYRHSLREEAEDLQAVADTVREAVKPKKRKKLDESLTNLLALSDAGLLEPYVLFARADAGIAQDYADYRKAKREKLRRYLSEYVAPMPRSDAR